MIFQKCNFFGIFQECVASEPTIRFAHMLIMADNLRSIAERNWLNLYYIADNVEKAKGIALIKRVLIICIGNICRSPTAENLMRDALVESDIEVRSAGLSALVDNPIEPTALVVLKERGCIAREHKAYQLTSKDVSEADLVLVMEQRQICDVLNLAPEARGKVFLLGKWQNNREIGDPYNRGKPAFLHAYALIEEAASAWAKLLSR